MDRTTSAAQPPRRLAKESTHACPVHRRTRIEKDSLAMCPCPRPSVGAQTERSRQNFRIGTEKMPPALIEAFAILKLCAARANGELGVLPPELAHAIEQAAAEVIEGRCPTSSRCLAAVPARRPT
ncbi:protein of unknown function (plasmid) [Cupriavidus taiwanensis]|nr:protein of unknown function [Cupriavidus taiwanensis]